MSNSDDASLPTIRERLSEWFGVQLPGLPAMPQTVKNLDKAVANVVLSLADNAKARIDGNTEKVKAGGKIDIDDLVRNSEERRKLENRADITRIAVEGIKENPGPSDANSEIETDWLNTFSRLSEDKSSTDLRSLFGKILAGEIRKPGSYSLRTLHFASALSRAEAELISRFLSYAFERGFVPHFETPRGPAISDRIAMQELGLASNASTIGGLAWTTTLPPSSATSFAGADFGIIIKNDSQKDIVVNISCQVLSQTAKDLLEISGSPPMTIEYARDVAAAIHKNIHDDNPDILESSPILVLLTQQNQADGKFYPIERIGAR